MRRYVILFFQYRTIAVRRRSFEPLLQPPSAPPPLYMDNAIAAHAMALQLPDSDQRRPLDCGGVRVEHRLLVVLLLLRLVRLWQGLEEVVELDRLALLELGWG